MQIGQYQVLRELGRGAMGVVYEAVAPGGGHVALKVILGAGMTPESVERFRREAEACARIQHPSVIRFLDAGLVEGRPFIAMEYLEGKTLSALLRERGRFSPEEAARLCADLARALGACHEVGVLHRDIKPENVLLRPNGRPVLTDFGLARPAVQAMERLTETGEILGTPGFMAPEQAEGDPDQIGPSADIHALGATLYALLTGVPPFRERTLLATLEAVLSKAPEPPSRHAPVPTELERVCLRCLEKDPQDRYPDAYELAQALDAAARPPARQGPSALAIAGGGVALLALGVLGGLFLRGSSPDSSASPRATQSGAEVRPSPSPSPRPSLEASPRPSLEASASPRVEKSQLEWTLVQVELLEAKRDYAEAFVLLEELPAATRENSAGCWIALARLHSLEGWIYGVSSKGQRATYVAATRALELLPREVSAPRSEAFYWRSLVPAASRLASAPSQASDLDEAARGTSAQAKTAQARACALAIQDRISYSDRLEAQDGVGEWRIALLKCAALLQDALAGTQRRSGARQRLIFSLGTRFDQLARVGGPFAFDLQRRNQAQGVVRRLARDPKSALGPYLLASFDKHLCLEVLQPLARAARQGSSRHKAALVALVKQVGTMQKISGEALLTFGMACSRDPRWPLVYRERGYLQYRFANGNSRALKLAAQDLKKASELEPAFYNNFHTLALIQLQRGEAREAWDATTQSVSLEPKLRPLWRTRLRAWLDLGAPDAEGAVLAAEVASHRPPSLAWLPDLVEGLAQLGAGVSAPRKRLSLICGMHPHELMVWQAYASSVLGDPLGRSAYLRDAKRALQGRVLPQATRSFLSQQVESLEGR